MRVHAVWSLMAAVWAFCVSAAAGAAQSGPVTGVDFSIQRGFYDAPFVLTIRALGDGARVRYTVDGSDPRTSSRALSGGDTVALTIDPESDYQEHRPRQRNNLPPSVLVRACAVVDGSPPSAVQTHTYIFPNHVVFQRDLRPAGGQAPPDYVFWNSTEMDPSLIGPDKEYSVAQVRDSLLSLPTVSIVMDWDAIFGPDGLHRGHKLSDSAQPERVASVELIYPQVPAFAGMQGFQAEAGFLTQGGGGRWHYGLYDHKQSFTLVFRREYGAGKLEYPFFESAPNFAQSGPTSINRIILRAGHNKSYGCLWDPVNTVYARDQLGRDLQIAMSGFGARGTFVHLYLNGIYWGLYNPSERPDASFFEHHFGGNPEDWYSSKARGGALGGSSSRFDLWRNSISRTSDFAELQEFLEVDAYIDMCLSNAYANTGDYPQFYMAMRNLGPGPLYFVNWDVEDAFGGKRSGHPSASHLDSNYEFSRMWNATERFRLRFADRVFKHCFNDGAMTDHRVLALWNNLCDFIESAMVAESARWGDERKFPNEWQIGQGGTDGSTGLTLTVRQHWNPARQAVARDLTGRRDRMVTSLRGANRYPGVDPPLFRNGSGIIEAAELAVDAGFQVTFENPNSSGSIHYTLDGSDPFDRSTPAANLQSITISRSAFLRARVLSGSTWSPVRDLVIHLDGGQDLSKLKITEIMYQPAHWVPGASEPSRITTFTTAAGGGGGVPSGVLVDFATAAPTGVTLTVAGGSFMGAVHAGQGAAPAAGTEAHAVFGGILNPVGVLSYSSVPATLTFSGLDPAARYSVALFGNRDAYAGTRWTDYLISGASGFSNTSSPGATKLQTLVADDTTRISAANTATGYLARFSDIDPGPDGSFVITIGGTMPYVNAVMLQATAGAAAFTAYNDLADLGSVSGHEFENLAISAITADATVPRVDAADDHFQRGRVRLSQNAPSGVTGGDRIVISGAASPENNGEFSIAYVIGRDVYLTNPLGSNQGAGGVATLLKRGDRYEFLELKNTGEETLDLTGLRLRGIGFSFPAGTQLGPGEFYVIAKNRSFFREHYGIEADAQYDPSSLSNSGERLRVVDYFGNVITSVDYGVSSLWSADAAGGGYSLVSSLADPTGSQDSATLWRRSARAGGSPRSDDPASSRPMEGGAVLHQWDFEDVTHFLAPTHSLGGGALAFVLGPNTQVLRNAPASGFGTAHLRINEPLGATLHLALPTNRFQSIRLAFQTRRSGQGAGAQTLEYTTDGASWSSFGSYAVADADPQFHDFDFSHLAAVNDNASFAVRISFSQGDGGLAGNNRFDNITVVGIPVPGANQPPVIQAPIAFQELVESGSALFLDLGAHFADPDHDPLLYSAAVDRPGVAAVQVSGSTLTVSPVGRGEATITVSAEDVHNLPLSTSFRVLVHPQAHVLANGDFWFGAWSPDEPAGSFPEHMLFLQGEENDSGLMSPLDRAYHIPLSTAAAPEDTGFPYRALSRTRINGLGEGGISFINTGWGRDLGGALLALDTRHLSSASVGWLAGTLLPNSRVYAIRLQYRLGHVGAFSDLLDQQGHPVEYLRHAQGHTHSFAPLSLPAETLGHPYLQLLWRYYRVSGDSGARAQLRLDDLLVARMPADPPSFAQWQLHHFSESERQNPAISGPEADPGRTGLPNLLRHALGLGRFEDGQSAQPSSLVEDGAVRYQHRRLSGGSHGLLYVVQICHDLALDCWSPATLGTDLILEEVVDNGDGLTETVRYRVLVPAPKNTVFLRLAVSLGNGSGD